MANSYTLFPRQKKVRLADLVGHSLDLQDTLRFSEGTQYTKEDLHYEDSPDPKIDAFEILIPIDAPILLLISPITADKGTPPFDRFEEVVVNQDYGVIIHPKACHFVKKAGHFMVLKTRGGWKFTRKENSDDPGNCRFQEECDIPKDQCPNPSGNVP